MRKQTFRRRAGLSLVEILMGLAIGAVLFTSLGSAIRAGIDAEATNSDYTRALQTARVALNNLAYSIRTAYDVDLEGVTTSDTPSSALRIRPREVPLEGKPLVSAYRWDSETKQLLFFPDALVTGPAAPAPRLARNIDNVTFTGRIVKDANATAAEVDGAEGSNFMVTQVTISMDVVLRRNEKVTEKMTISASASPRRALRNF
jgi:type II secretory pathway pseudopilin PulG